MRFQHAAGLSLCAAVGSSCGGAGNIAVYAGPGPDSAAVPRLTCRPSGMRRPLCLARTDVSRCSEPSSGTVIVPAGQLPAFLPSAGPRFAVGDSGLAGADCTPPQWAQNGETSDTCTPKRRGACVLLPSVGAQVQQAQQELEAEQGKTPSSGVIGTVITHSGAIGKQATPEME